MLTLFLPGGVRRTDATIKIVNDQVFVECPGVTWSLGDRLAAEIDGKRTSFIVQRRGPAEEAQVLVWKEEHEDHAFVQTDFARALSNWLLAIVNARLHPRPPTVFWLKVTSVTQNIATLLAAIGLFFGLYALLGEETLKEETAALYIKAMIWTVLGFAIVWFFAIGFQVYAYWRDK
jgi:hypothetical protein